MKTSQEESVVDRLSRNGSVAGANEAWCEGRTSPPSTELRQNIRASKEHRHAGEVVKEEDAAKQMSPPDGGWGWLVVLGSFIIMVLSQLFGTCFGVNFSRYLMEVGSSSSTNAWIFNIMFFIWNMTGILIRPLTKEFGWRRVGIIGASFSGVSFIMSAFTPFPEFLFFSFSLLGGLGAGMMVTMCFVIVPLYFDRKRGLANAIMLGGMSVGQIVDPPVARFLQDEYGFSGATLILGALLLHGCLGASFFHPIEWHMKKSHPPPEGSAPLIPPAENKSDTNADLVNCTSKVSLGDSKGDLESQMVKTPNGSHITEASGVSTKSLEQDVVTVPEAEQRDKSHPSSKVSQKKPPPLCTTLLRVARSTVSDLGILRSPRAFIIALAKSLSLNAGLNFMMIVPFATQAAGLTLDDAAWCISVLGICSLLLRLLVSSLSDWKRFNTCVCHVIGYAIIAVSMFIFPFVTDLTWLLATMGLLGCGVGANIGVSNLVIIDVMGREKFPTTFGASCFLGAVGFIILGPLIGFIRDVSKSYALSICVLAAMELTSFILWLFMPAAIKYDQRREKKNKEKEEKIKP